MEQIVQDVFTAATVTVPMRGRWFVGCNLMVASDNSPMVLVQGCTREQYVYNTME